MASIAILIILIGVVSCGPAVVSHGDTGRLVRKLGSKQCTFGPSYWCDHVSKASECGMTSWCIDNVWQHMDLPQDDDDVCSICKEMVKEARDQLNSNETQEELKEVLEGSCNLIPIHIIAEECDTLVDDFTPELTEMLTSQMNPQVVCQTAGLCNSARIDRLLEEQRPDTCAVCEKRTEVLRRTVAAGGEQQLLDSLLPLCRDLGSYSDACAADLAAHIGPILAGLTRMDPEGVCQLGNACPGLYDEPPPPLSSVSGPSVDCDLCIHIVKHWRDILVANTTKEEFKEKVVPEKVQPKKKLHSVKLHKSSPRRAYGNDGLSHGNPLDSGDSAAAAEQHQLPLARLGLPDVSHLFRPDTELCDLCEFGLHELQKVLQDGATEDEIAEEVERLCDLLPGPLTGRCRQFVSDYGSFVVQLLAEELDPAQVCPALRLCPLPSLLASEETSMLASEETSDELSPQGDQEAEAPGCAICEYAMNTLLDDLKDKKTEDEIRKGLDRVCGLLPATVSRECQELVNTFLEELIDMVVSGMTADEICITLHLCHPAVTAGNDLWSNSIHAVPPAALQLTALGPALAGLPVNSPHMPAEPVSSESSEEEEEEEDGQSPVCVLCEFVMMQLKLKLDDNSTDEEIEAALQQVCGYMPQSVRADCRGFVDEYGAAVLAALKAELADPDTVCRQLTLCQSTEP